MNKFKPIVFTSVWTEAKDYLFITFGLLLYAFGWAGFLIPNKITTGGVTGISAIVYYGTGIPIQNTYVLINIVLLVDMLNHLFGFVIPALCIADQSKTEMLFPGQICFYSGCVPAVYSRFSFNPYVIRMIIYQLTAVGQ